MPLTPKVSITRRSTSTPMRPTISKSCDAASMAFPIMVRVMNHCNSAMITSVTAKMNNCRLFMVSVLSPKGICITLKSKVGGYARACGSQTNAARYRRKVDAPSAVINEASLGLVRSGRYASRSIIKATKPLTSIAMISAAIRFTL